jgi:hypothetical protein
MSTLRLTPHPFQPQRPGDSGRRRTTGGRAVDFSHQTAPQAGTDTGVRHFLELRKDAVLSLRGCRVPRALRCIAGRVWITQSGDSRDHLLHPGRLMHPLKSAHVVITALEDATIEAC